MKDTHGNLENEILNAIWRLEESKTDVDISVNEIFNILNCGKNYRAYTTIKTVMDRLVEKQLLTRCKIGKRFCYNSTTSRQEMAQKAIQKLVGQYFHNDLRSLMTAIESECLQLIR